MCGISGEWACEVGGNCEPAALQQMSVVMRRRGPDDSGYWTDGKRCQFAFRRLAILDVTDSGHQPMLTSDGSKTLVFNGEVYNYSEIRRDLEGRGVQFRSTGDTEVVLQALAHWGTTALERFNGMFALAFYDVSTQKLLLARDHAGIKPLYYAVVKKGVIFGSQYDQVIQHPWMQGKKILARAVHLYLQLGHIPAPFALLEDSAALPPGSWLQVAPNTKMTVGSHFEFPRLVEPTLSGKLAEEAVGEAVAAAVKRQMVSDVPVGCFLSGGIDSPLVAAKIAQVSGSVPAFTLGTGGDRHDESQDAARYAELLGHSHYVEQLTPARAMDLVDDAIAACSEPLSDISIIPTLFVSGMAASHVKVVLSGDGGDELFWGYAGRFASALQRLSHFQRPEWLRRARWLAKHVFPLRRQDSPYFSTLGDWFRNKHSRIRQPWLARVFPDLPSWPDDFDAFEYRSTDLDQSAQWLRWNEFVVHLPRVLQKVDRGSMFYSLEVRVPLLDKDVIDVATRVDWTSCLDLNSHTGKLPLRSVLKRHCGFQTTAKRGFTVAINEWMRGKMGVLFRERVLREREIAGQAVCQKQLERVYREHCSRERNHGYAMWTLLVLCLWSDRYLSQPVRSIVA